jgi:DNA replication protein DnaC
MNGCKKCNDEGYIIAESGSRAVAKECECMRPCPICNDRRFIKVIKQGYEFEKPCECTILEHKISIFNNARIPGRFFDCSVENYEDLGGNQKRIKYETLDFISRLEPNKGKGILFSGPTGTGKTHLAVAILKFAIFELGLKAVFIDFFEFTALIKQGYGRGVSEMDLILPLLDNDLICIDELGKGRNTEWELGILDQFMSRAYNDNKILVITTNYPLTSAESETSFFETLEERTGPRIFSRLNEMCRMLVVQGPDARLKK